MQEEDGVGGFGVVNEGEKSLPREESFESELWGERGASLGMPVCQVPSYSPRWAELPSSH